MSHYFISVSFRCVYILCTNPSSAVSWQPFNFPACSLPESLASFSGRTKPSGKTIRTSRPHKSSFSIKILEEKASFSAISAIAVRSWSKAPASARARAFLIGGCMCKSAVPGIQRLKIADDKGCRHCSSQGSLSCAGRWALPADTSWSHAEPARRRKGHRPSQGRGNCWPRSVDVSDPSVCSYSGAVCSYWTASF